MGSRVAWRYNSGMNTAASIPIEDLSTADKILLMERLWENLSRRPTDIISPNWHGDVLAERRAAVLDGRTAFVDWEEAKKRLRERLQ
jgi:putative addiction module component (TIGR02574 family)